MWWRGCMCRPMRGPSQHLRFLDVVTATREGELYFMERGCAGCHSPAAI